MADWVIYKDGYYWSDDYGWRNFSKATHYSPDEKTHIPIGKWVDVHEILAWMQDKNKESIPSEYVDSVRRSETVKYLSGVHGCSDDIIIKALYLASSAMLKFDIHLDGEVYPLELVGFVPDWLLVMAKGVCQGG